MNTMRSNTNSKIVISLTFQPQFTISPNHIVNALNREADRFRNKYWLKFDEINVS